MRVVTGDAMADPMPEKEMTIPLKVPRFLWNQLPRMIVISMKEKKARPKPETAARISTRMTERNHRLLHVRQERIRLVLDLCSVSRK